MAGDSTMQSYGAAARPQMGWGEKLIDFMDADEEHVLITHRADCPFDQEIRYESTHLIIDNCAMAGRSSRSFREEGRLEDIKRHMNEGDWLVIQFGHNDMAVEKPERYVPIALFEESLLQYLSVAADCKATPILISPITLRPCEKVISGELKSIAEALPAYVTVMKQVASKWKLRYIDMWKESTDLCDRLGEKSKELYLEDDVHLLQKGAEIYAKIAAAGMLVCR
ncbi:MAG: GDSL-type esterase/lipase family protein [Hungatella sp.]